MGQHDERQESAKTASKQHDLIAFGVPVRYGPFGGIQNVMLKTPEQRPLSAARKLLS